MAEEEGRATPYEDALSALALEDKEGSEGVGLNSPQRREWTEQQQQEAEAEAEATAPPAVSLEAAVPADVDPADDNHDDNDQGESAPPSPSPPSPSLLLDPSKAKHVLVLSNAGKPIFSRHGDEQRLAPLMGMVQAIISLTAVGDSGEEGSDGGGDCVRSITTAGGRKFVFLARGELYLLAVARTGEPEPYLKLQLEYLYQQARGHDAPWSGMVVC